MSRISLARRAGGPGPARTEAAPAAGGNGRPPTTPAPAVTTIRTLVVASVLVLTIIALAFFLHAILPILLTFLVAVVFAEGIRPLVYRLQRWRLPKVLAILAVLIAMIAVTALLVALLVQPLVTEAQSLAAHVPEYQRSVTTQVNDIQASLHLSSDLSSQITNSLNTAKDLLLTISGYIVSFLVNFVIVLVVGFLWLTTSDRLKLFVIDLFPTRYQALVGDIIQDIGFRMGGYLRAVAINALVVGLMSGIASALLRLPSPLLLGIFAGLTSVIPLVGPFVGALPAVLLGFTVSPLYPLLVAGVFAAVMLVDGNTVVPLVMNRVLNLPALGVVLALLVGGTVAGLAGALLAVPVAAALQILVVRVLVPAIHQSQGRGGSLAEAAVTAAAARTRPAGLPERRRTPRA